jgi:hypothetical protein
VGLPGGRERQPEGGVFRPLQQLALALGVGRCADERAQFAMPR